MMDDTPTGDTRAGTIPVRRGTRTGLKVALVSAGVIAGAIGATAIGASAASSSTSGTGSSSSGYTQTAPSGAPSGAPRNGTGQRPDPGGANPVRSDEKSLSATATATLKAAALKAAPGATVIRVETDSGDAAYEVHMKKADGTLVTVKFDKNYAVTGVEDGMGK
jgi:hypothetical protein